MPSRHRSLVAKLIVIFSVGALLGFGCCMLLSLDQPPALVLEVGLLLIVISIPGLIITGSIAIARKFMKADQ